VNVKRREKKAMRRKREKRIQKIWEVRGKTGFHNFRKPPERTKKNRNV
jgi:hypothetical protein